MGDIADMMLEGLLDEETGEYIGDSNLAEYGTEAPGFPVSLERRSREGGLANCTTQDGRPIYRPGKTNCPHCNKLVKQAGLADHLRDKHND